VTSEHAKPFLSDRDKKATGTSHLFERKSMPIAKNTVYSVLAGSIVHRRQLHAMFMLCAEEHQAQAEWKRVPLTIEAVGSLTSGNCSSLAL